jgi:hypothetical protein
MEARSHTGKTAAHIMPCSGDADENMAEEKKKDKIRDEIEREPKVLTLHCSSLQPYDSTSAFVAAAALLSSAVYLSQALKQKQKRQKCRKATAGKFWKGAHNLSSGSPSSAAVPDRNVTLFHCGKAAWRTAGVVAAAERYGQVAAGHGAVE